MQELSSLTRDWTCAPCIESTELPLDHQRSPLYCHGKHYWLYQPISFFFFLAMPCSMQNFPDKGLNPCRLQWKHIVLTTRPPRVSILTASYSFSYDSVFYVLGGGGDIQGDGEGRVWSLSVWFYILTLPHNHRQACLFIFHRVGMGGKWELVYVILLLIWPSAFSLDSYHTCPVDLLISSRPVWSCPSFGHFPSINHISCCYCLVNKLCSIFLQPHGL